MPSCWPVSSRSVLSLRAPAETPTSPLLSQLKGQESQPIPAPLPILEQGPVHVRLGFVCEIVHLSEWEYGGPV